MKIMTNRLSAVLILGLSVMVAPPVAEAQFLKKISKGLENVNKKLEKVEKAIGDNGSRKGPDKASAPSQKSSVQASAQSSSKTHEYPVVTREYNHPYVTSETRYMQLESVYDDTYSDVYDGVFTVKQNNLFSFWTIDGKCLFGPEWMKRYVEEDPRFDSGVAVALHHSKKVNGKEVYSLLYLDGSVRQLDPNWTYVSQFYDGLALVEQTVNYKKTYFFINPRGEKVFPTLVMTSKATVNPIRPLSDGLRAVYMKNGAGTLWGFIDAAGKIVIPAKYYAAEDFHGGYCWVKETVTSQNWILIDKTGKEVFRTIHSPRGPVGNDIFYIAQDGKTVYYDVTGKELSRQEDGNSFYKGYAFIGRDHNTVSLVDTKFNELKTYPTKVLNGVTTSQYGPWFGPYGLGSDHQIHGSIVLSPDGKIILSDWASKYEKEMLGLFGPFRKSGFAKLKAKIDHKDYGGLMDSEGRVVWLFGTTSAPSFNEMPVKPEPWEPGDTVGDRVPGGPDPVDPKQPPIGPKVWSAHTYSASISKEGEGSVSVSKTSGIKYGDAITFNATPAKDWAVASIECFPQIPGAVPGAPITVTSDVRIKVKFIKKEDIKPVQTGVYQGTLHIQSSKPGGLSDDIPVYAELSADNKVDSPYGAATSGFMVLMFDPCKRYADTDMETYIFCAPFKVVGSQVDADGREWLVAEGGDVTFGNLKVNPKDPLMYLYINMAMAFDGHSSPTCIPRRYRIEILDRDKEKDEFTFGELQTYSAAGGGWVDAQNKAAQKVTKGLIVTKVDKGFDADLVRGVRMKPSQKRTDVNWYPPSLWYDNNETTLRRIVEQMGNAYRTYQSDYDKLFDK